MSANRAAENRLRWQSRRGWLELDLLLEQFWQQHGDALSAAESARLADWLDLTDEELWRLLRQPPANGRHLADKINPKKLAEEAKTSTELT